MGKFILPWEEEPIATIVNLFGCTVQHVESIKEEDGVGDKSVEDHEE